MNQEKVEEDMWTSIQRNMTWRAIPVAGIVAGTVFLLVNMILSPVMLGVNPSLILSYIASLVLGSSVLMEPSAVTLVTGVRMIDIYVNESPHSMFF